MRQINLSQCWGESSVCLVKDAARQENRGLCFLWFDCRHKRRTYVRTYVVVDGEDDETNRTNGQDRNFLPREHRVCGYWQDICVFKRDQFSKFVRGFRFKK